MEDLMSILQMNLKRFDNTQKENIISLLRLIYTNKENISKSDIDEYIFENRANTYCFFNELLALKNDYPNLDFFYYAISDIKNELDASTQCNLISDKDFIDKCNELVPYYYFSLANSYRQVVFEHERNLRTQIDYPIEAYEYKANNDSRPLVSNAYFAHFHLF